MKAFYDRNQARIRQPYDKIKAPLEQYMRRQKVSAQRSELMAQLRKDADVKVMMQGADSGGIDRSTAPVLPDRAALRSRSSNSPTINALTASARNSRSRKCARSTATRFD